MERGRRGKESARPLFNKAPVGTGGAKKNEHGEESMSTSPPSKLEKL